MEQIKNEINEPGEAVGKTIIQLRTKLEIIKRTDQKIELSEIHAIRELLAEIPNLVINFDNTITKPPEADATHPERKLSNYSNHLFLYKGTGWFVRSHC